MTLLLRASLLMLLALGVIVRPALNLVGELHGTAHAAATAMEHGHGHAGDDHEADHDPDHAKGTHTLMHQFDAGSSAGLLTSFHLPEAFALPAAVLEQRQVVPPHEPPTSPFRPPIA